MKKMQIIFLIFNLLNLESLSFYSVPTPKISIITSVYNGDKFIKGFLEDIVKQTIFNRCELIIINANSPGNEESIIKEYAVKYPNIFYIHLRHDPGIYGVWNLGIALSDAEYITNANIDDRLKSDCYAVHAKVLDEYPNVDLVYSDFLTTYTANETFQKNNADYIMQYPEFSQENMRLCLPNNHPMWRKSLHKKFGLFNENLKYAGDWEMWLRSASQGAVFLKIPGAYGLYLRNPEGLSTSKENDKQLKYEMTLVLEKYKDYLKIENMQPTEFFSLSWKMILKCRKPI